MHGSDKVLLLILILLSPSCGLKSLKSVTVGYDEVNSEDLGGSDGEIKSQVYSSIYKTAKEFFCQYDGIENPEMLVYGTKAWTFPKQTANLTLSYPSVNEKPGDASERYVITGFNVIVIVDNSNTKGYITGGGLLQDSITLNFFCDDVTMLTYEFWLFGVRAAKTYDTKWTVGSTDMC